MTVHELIGGLPAGAFERPLRALYGDDAPRQTARLLEIARAFAQTFGEDRQVAVFSAPGRSEIGGNHTDHNRGRVLAAGVNLDILGVAAVRDDMRVVEKSAGHARNDIDLSSLAPVKEETGHSAAMIRGICAGLAQRGYQIGGFEAATHSEVLGGSGLSSSAAFEVFIATILNHFYNDGQIPPLTLAQVSQYAENAYVGKPCGLMDQTACAVGGFVAIDFADTANPVVERVNFDFDACGYALCVVNSGGSHADLTGEYAAIPAEMKAVAAALGGEALRETEQTQLIDQLPALRERLGDRALLRALHFYAENERAGAQAAALERGDFPAFLRLVRESGRSSFMYNQNIYASQSAREQPVSLALALSETVLGERGAWRVHGGGFAGTIQAFVPLDMLAAYRARMEAVFGAGCCYVLKVRQQGGVRVL